MKKISNNRFRNNNNNSAGSIYSLNYKFDSVSSAGKLNGTALDLIKKYNELAKEAQSRGDYVDMEVYRQYAEHYRKIVTEINSRRTQNRDANQPNQQTEEETQSENSENQPVETENNLVETEPAPRAVSETEMTNTTEEIAEKPTRVRHTKRSFTIVEVGANETDSAISANENIEAEAETAPKKRRMVRKKAVAQSEEE